ncbi:DUF1800 domain-containing protein [soil metagenome]
MTMRTRAVWFCLLASAAPAGAQERPAAPQREQPAAPQGRELDAVQVERARHLLSRATWGVRPADLDAVLATGREAWLERQLNPDVIPDTLVVARLAAYPTTFLPVGTLYRDFSPQPAQQRDMQAMRDSLRAAMTGSGGGGATDQMTPPMLRDMQGEMTPEQRRERQERNPARLLMDLLGAKLQRAVHSERQLEDVMADFWFNHFNVFFGKNQVRYLAADYERTAIRPHVFGRFEDMLLATARHPAMLFYLDNWTSVHVDPAAAGPLAQRQRDRGLNENYARELLELHTLGVDGGYTQQDVIAVARAFTGWSFIPYNQNGRQQQLMQVARQRQVRGGPQAQWVLGEGDAPFVFRPEMHDRNEKLILGRRLGAGRGMDDGRDVISMLSRHPSTAKHIATKLVARFVTDEPAEELVSHIAQVFLTSGGDLRAVTRALFTSEEFYRSEYIGAKVKTPYELVASALRVTHADVQSPVRLAGTLRAMGHMPYSEPAPTGFPAMSEDWVNTGAMLNRMNFALELAAGQVQGVRVTRALLLQGAGMSDVDGLLNSVMPATDTQRLAGLIREDAGERGGMPPRERASRTLGLALGSPEFQRR